MGELGATWVTYCSMYCCRAHLTISSKRWRFFPHAFMSMRSTGEGTLWVVPRLGTAEMRRRPRKVRTLSLQDDRPVLVSLLSPPE